MIFPRIGTGRSASSYAAGFEYRERRTPAFVMRWMAISAMGMLIGGLSYGCARRSGPVFEPPSRSISWPAPPARPRIRYVGMLRGADDLKPRRTGLHVLARVFMGKKESETLYGPRSVVCTPDGERVWIADVGGRCLHRFDLNKRKYMKVRRAGDQPFLSVVAVAQGPDGSIYAIDSERVAIYRLDDRSGRLLESLRLPSELLRPADLHYDKESGELFVVDVTGHSIEVLAPDGTLRRIIGHRGSQPGEFNFPTGITAHADELWVVDTGNHRVQAITHDGTPIQAIGQAGDAPGDMALPKGVAIDPAGNIYVVDSRFENVQVFDRTGRLLLFFGGEGTGLGEFWLPAGIFIEPNGRIWVCDAYNRRVQVFQFVGGQNRDE